jgi:hypothetical protein
VPGSRSWVSKPSIVFHTAFTKWLLSSNMIALSKGHLYSQHSPGREHLQPQQFLRGQNQIAFAACLLDFRARKSAVI